MTQFVVVIPARYGSSRLPGKPLLQIAGKPMIQHVVENAIKSGAKQVVVATDDERIQSAVDGFSGEAIMTRKEHQSGTERIAEVVDKLQLSEDTIVVNVQGDEPQLPAELINQVAQLLAVKTEAEMATLATQIESSDEYLDAAAVKVVCNQDDYALYFSRAPIPFARHETSSELDARQFQHAMRHLGVYAYRAGFIQRYAQLPVSPLEQIEKLEQLRVLWNGHKIACAKAISRPGPGVDTLEDLQLLRKLMQSQ